MIDESCVDFTKKSSSHAQNIGFDSKPSEKSSAPIVGLIRL